MTGSNVPPLLLTADEIADLPVTRTTPVDALPELLTPEEFRTVAGLGRATTYDLIRRGQIPSVRFGRVIRIPKSALLVQDERE